MSILSDLDAACAEARRRVNIGIGRRAIFALRAIREQAELAQRTVRVHSLARQGRPDWSPLGYTEETDS